MGLKEDFWEIRNEIADEANSGICHDVDQWHADPGFADLVLKRFRIIEDLAGKLADLIEKMPDTQGK